LAFWGAIIFSGYVLLFRSMPTCFDARQNGTETGIDCGGGCAPCGQKYAQDIGVDSIARFAAGDTRTVVVAYLENPNREFGFKDVTYTITATDKNGMTIKASSDHIFLYDRSSKIGRYVVATIDAGIEEIDDLVMTFSAPEVVAREDFIEPRVNIKRSSTDVVGVRIVTEPLYVFTKDLAMKATGEDVQKLEEFLYKKQFFMKLSDETFDLDTKIALTAYQKANNISPESGIFDAETRTNVNADIERVTKAIISPDGSVSINGNIKNDDISDASKVVITGLLYDAMGIQVGGSKTELDNLRGAEERIFKILFPKTVPIDRVDTSKTRLYVDSIK